MIANDQYETVWSFKSGLIISMQTRRNFGERVLSIFLTKIMAAIFDFNGSGRLGRERSLYQGVVDSQKYVERWGGRVKITPVRLSSLIFLPKFLFVTWKRRLISFLDFSLKPSMSLKVNQPANSLKREG